MKPVTLMSSAAAAAALTVSGRGNLTNDEAHGGCDWHHGPDQSHVGVVHGLRGAHDESTSDPCSCLHTNTLAHRQRTGAGQMAAATLTQLTHV